MAEKKHKNPKEVTSKCLFSYSSSEVQDLIYVVTYIPPFRNQKFCNPDSAMH